MAYEHCTRKPFSNRQNFILNASSNFSVLFLIKGNFPLTINFSLYSSMKDSFILKYGSFNFFKIASQRKWGLLAVLYTLHIVTMTNLPGIAPVNFPRSELWLF